MTTGLERRLHRRVQLDNAWAKVHALDAGGRRLIARVNLVDMSFDGVCWRGEGSFAIPEGTAIQLTIRGGWFERSLEVPAVVVRRDESTSSVAAQFLATADRTRFSRYLHHARSSEVPAVSLEAAAALKILGIGIERTTPTRPHVTLISSARDSEGKDFVAAGIASALASFQRQVLLIDVDWRHTAEHLAFGPMSAPGLAQLLVDNTLSLADVTQQTDAGVAVAYAGSAIAARALFSDAGISRLAELIRLSNYSHVILDAPPLLLAAEGLLLSRIADDVLLTARAGATRERDIRQALELLSQQGKPAAGVILNEQADTVGWGYTRAGTALAPRATETGSFQNPPETVLSLSSVR